MSARRENKPSGIRDIAEALDISIGTVDRALHNRPGVSEGTRDRVLKMAARLRYSPNVTARNLKLNRQLRIGIYLPRQIKSYFDVLRDGMRDAAEAETGVSVGLVFHDYELLGRGDVDAISKSDWQSFDGLVIAPGNSPALLDLSREIAAHKRALICVSTDGPRLSRLSSITADSFVSGGIAAELLGGWIQNPGRAVLFTGDLQVQDHADKLRGFAATLATSAPHLTLAPAVESHDTFEEAYRAARRILRDESELRGIYVNTANSLPVLQAVSESGRGGSLRIVTTDLFPKLVPFLENGSVSASLYQRPYRQGKLAVEALCSFVLRGIPPRSTTRLAPHIILRSNLPLFTETLNRQSEAAADHGRNSGASVA